MTRSAIAAPVSPANTSPDTLANTTSTTTESGSSLPESLAKVVKKFARIDDPKRGYELLIWFAKKLPTFPDADRLPANKVQGCTSQVYITAACAEGKMHFQGDSDSQLVKGLVGLLVVGLNGLSAAEVLALSPTFIQQTKLNVSLTPSRANGFYNIFQMMKQKTLVIASQTMTETLTETLSPSEPETA